MFRNALMFFILLTMCATLHGILCIPLIGSGEWGDLGMWGSHTPTAEDDVLIPNGYTITAGYGTLCRNLTVEGMLQSRWGAESMMIVWGDLTIGLTGHTQPQFGGNIIYQLHGDLAVNGYYMVDYTYFWGDGSENMYVTLSQGPGATIFSNFTQSEPTIELQLLTDLNLISGSTKSEFTNGEFDLNGHKLSNTKFQQGYVRGNSYDWTCGIGDCQLSSTELWGNVATWELVELMDDHCDALGTVQNNGYLTGGWGLTVAWQVHNLINDGTFYTQMGSSLTAYLNGIYTLSAMFWNWNPNSLQIFSTPEGLMHLSWQSTEGGASYQILKSTSPDAGFTLCGTSITNSYTDPVAETRAYYRVIANSQ